MKIISISKADEELLWDLLREFDASDDSCMLLAFGKRFGKKEGRGDVEIVVPEKMAVWPNAVPMIAKSVSIPRSVIKQIFEAGWKDRGEVIGEEGMNITITLKEGGVGAISFDKALSNAEAEELSDFFQHCQVIETITEFLQSKWPDSSIKVEQPEQNGRGRIIWKMRK